MVAAETFSDLRTVVTERAPFVFTPGTIDKAIRLAEQQGRFQMPATDEVLHHHLREAGQLDDIQAVFVDIDSPGGTVADAPELAAAGIYQENFLAKRPW